MIHKHISQLPKGLLRWQGASIGDVDGDGQLEVVVGTAAGRVHALLGSDGTDKVLSSAGCPVDSSHFAASTLGEPCQPKCRHCALDAGTSITGDLKLWLKPNLARLLDANKDRSDAVRKRRPISRSRRAGASWRRFC